MRFLVTGGAGYIGSHFVHAAVKQQHACLIYDDLRRGHREFVPGNVTLVCGDVSDVLLLRKTISEFAPDVILHFAAYALVGESMRQPEVYYQNNVGGTLALLTAIKANGRPIPVVFSSSCAVFGNPVRVPVYEEDAKAPTSPYGRSKLIAEQILADFAEANDNRVMSFRYFNAAGASSSGTIGEWHEPETHLVPNVLGCLAADKPIPVLGNDYPTPDGTCVRDYIHVDDLAEAHILGAKYLTLPKKAGTANFTAIHLGTGTGHSVLEVIRAAERVTGKKAKLEFQPRRAGDPASLFADTKAAREALAFKAQHSSIENILQTAWRWQQTLVAKKR